MPCSIPRRSELRVVRGPVFTHILLADEINRAPAKTQSALLEVMQEYQVTLEGQTLLLPKPFMVLATQNPVETEGTYPLPEAQLDRFLFKIEIGYPSLPRTRSGSSSAPRPTRRATSCRSSEVGRASTRRRRQAAGARRPAARGRAGGRLRRPDRACDARLSRRRGGQRFARRARAGARRPRRGPARRPRVRDARRRQAGRAAGAAPSHRLDARRAARRAQRRRLAARWRQSRRRGCEAESRPAEAGSLPSRRAGRHASLTAGRRSPRPRSSPWPPR